MQNQFYDERAGVIAWLKGDLTQVHGHANLIVQVTHRVRISEAKEINAKVLDWIKQAYDAA